MIPSVPTALKYIIYYDQKNVYESIKQEKKETYPMGGVMPTPFASKFRRSMTGLASTSIQHWLQNITTAIITKPLYFSILFLTQWYFITQCYFLNLHVSESFIATEDTLFAVVLIGIVC